MTYLITVDSLAGVSGAVVPVYATTIW